MKPLAGSIEAEAQADREDEIDEREPGRSAPTLPDEDGPHDVPDETVIEKTLPTVPVNTGA